MPPALPPLPAELPPPDPADSAVDPPVPALPLPAAPELLPPAPLLPPPAPLLPPAPVDGWSSSPQARPDNQQPLSNTSAPARRGGVAVRRVAVRSVAERCAGGGKEVKVMPLCRSWLG